MMSEAETKSLSRAARSAAREGGFHCTYRSGGGVEYSRPGGFRRTGADDRRARAADALLLAASFRKGGRLDLCRVEVEMAAAVRECGASTDDHYRRVRALLLGEVA